MKVEIVVEQAVLAGRAHAYADIVMGVFVEGFPEACGDGELRDAVHRIAGNAFMVAYVAAMDDVSSSFERSAPAQPRRSNAVRRMQLVHVRGRKR